MALKIDILSVVQTLTLKYLETDDPVIFKCLMPYFLIVYYYLRRNNGSRAYSEMKCYGLILYLPKFKKKMAELAPCPECKSTYTYEMDNLLVCPECAYEWNPEDSSSVTGASVVKDSNGNILADGDSVIVIKNLPVKGSSQNIKAGTKVKNIKLVDGDHNIDCKIDGFGAMALKSEFVRKA
jgi:protein PhnA